MTINKYEKAREKFWVKYNKINNKLLEISEQIESEKNLHKLDDLMDKHNRYEIILAKLESLRDEKAFIKAVDEGVF